jgi:hypothetical protein
MESGILFEQRYVKPSDGNGFTFPPAVSAMLHPVILVE